MIARLNELTLPTSGQLSDGTWVSNYDKLPIDVLLKEGWLPLEEVKPEFDELTQMLVLDSTKELDGKIIATYKAALIPLYETEELENLLLFEMGVIV